MATIPQEGKDLAEMLGIKPQRQEDVENFSSVAGSVLCRQSLDSTEVLPLPKPDQAKSGLETNVVGHQLPPDLDYKAG